MTHLTGYSGENYVAELDFNPNGKFAITISNQF